ncbi:MAG: porin [Proteobacteria bacterium]|nr:porin [Pseudomonadota bacterium]
MRRFQLSGVTAAATLLAAAVVAPCARADDATPAKPTAPALADLLGASGITITGYVAASYYHSSGYNSFHEFDVEHDTFQLDQAGLQVGYQPKEGFGAFVDVLAGEDARILNYSENGTDSTFNVRQAYAQYARGSFTIIGGKYTTLAGYEYSNPVGNTNFSRSLLFYAEPLTHTGVRATWAATDTLSLTVGANNGWNTTSTSYGSKTLELAAALTPLKGLTLNLEGYFGKEPSYDAQRDFIDFVGAYAITDALTIALSYDWGKQQQVAGEDLKWDGIAAYVNYALSSQWRVSLRGEYLDDKDGFVTGTPQKLKEGTLTFGYSPVKNFELRLEARYDTSGESTFLKSVHAGGDGNTYEYADNQSEIAIQALYKF